MSEKNRHIISSCWYVLLISGISNPYVWGTSRLPGLALFWTGQCGCSEAEEGRSRRRRDVRSWWRDEGSCRVPAGTGNTRAQLPARARWSWCDPSAVQLIISHPDCAYHGTLREMQCHNKVKTWWPGEGFRSAITSASKVRVDGGTVSVQRPKRSCKLKGEIRKKGT